MVVPSSVITFKIESVKVRVVVPNEPPQTLVVSPTHVPTRFGNFSSSTFSLLQETKAVMIMTDAIKILNDFFIVIEL